MNSYSFHISVMYSIVLGLSLSIVLVFFISVSALFFHSRCLLNFLALLVKEKGASNGHKRKTESTTYL